MNKPLRKAEISAVQIKVVDSTWTVKQVAAYFQVSENRVRHWMMNGDMQFINTPGGHPRILHSEIERFTKTKI
jgi:excisionase family DNA binding protein